MRNPKRMLIVVSAIVAFTATLGATTVGQSANRPTRSVGTQTTGTAVPFGPSQIAGTIRLPSSAGLSSAPPNAAAATHLSIVPNFDTAVTSSPLASQIESAFNYAIGEFEADYSNPITVDINVDYSGSGLGQSNQTITCGTYAVVKSALVAGETTPDQIASAQDLPATDPSGSTTAQDSCLSFGEAMALGLLPADCFSNTCAGHLPTITFGVQPYTFDPSHRAVAGEFDFIGVAEHEISEVLGRIPGLNLQSFYTPDDLFRFTASGVRNLTAYTPGAYFSIDNGATRLVGFNTVSGEDPQDYATASPDSFDAAAGTGSEYPLTTAGLTNVDVLGYDRVIPPALTIAKAHTGPFVSGLTGTYSLSVSNTGGATSGTVTDTLPTGETFASGSGGGFSCSAVGQAVTCTSTTPIVSGTPAVINLTVNVTAAAGTVLSNQASVSPNGGTSNTDQVTVSPGSAYHPLTPYRICDTRSGNPSGLSGLNLTQCDSKTIGAGGTLTIAVGGTNPSGTTSGGVPSTGATAVVLNVTATNPSAASYLTAWPAGTTQPLASNLNFTAGATVPNLVTVAVPASGQVSLFNAQGTADVVVDVEGYYAAPSGTAGLFNGLNPYRVCDTRAGNPSGLSGLDLTQCQGKTIGAGGTLTLQVTGTNPSGTTSGGVPSTGVSAVVLNVTATNPSAASYLTAWPAGATRPTASNLNFTAGETVPNRVMVPVSPSGQVSIFNGQGSADAIVDVNGWFTDGSSPSQTGDVFTASSPQRICDTRPTGVSGITDQCTGKTIGAGGTLGVGVAGQGTVPATGVLAAVVNVTAVDQTAPGYFTVWPTGSPQGTVSDLNWPGNDTVPNMTVVQLGTGGSVNIFNSAGTSDAIVDVEGWYTSG